MFRSFKIARLAAYSIFIALAGFLGSLYVKNKDFTTSLPSPLPSLASADTPYSGGDCDSGGGGGGSCDGGDGGSDGGGDGDGDGDGDS